MLINPTHSTAGARQFRLQAAGKFADQYLANQLFCNLPGMLGRLNEVLARHAVNIAAQYYETAHDVGYVVLDADASAADGARVLADIRALEGTIRARLLYEYKI